MKTQIYFLKYWLIAILLTSSFKGISQCPDLQKLTGYGAEYSNRCFVLNAINGTKEPIRFRLVRGDCYEGQDFNENMVVNPTCGQQIGICRVQGRGCDGRDGLFDIEIMSPFRLKGKRLSLSFTNNNGIRIIRGDNNLDCRLSQPKRLNNRTVFDLILNERIRSTDNLGPQTAFGYEYTQRCFTLNVYNKFNEPIGFKLIGSDCYEGQSFNEAKVVAPNNGHQIGICRVQGNGCDGKNGKFSIEITSPARLKGKQITLGFTNDLFLFVRETSGGFNYQLSSLKQGIVNNMRLPYYDLNLREIQTTRFNDKDLQQTVAKTLWSKAPSEIKRFVFENSNNCWGNFYESCAGQEVWHMQHIVRLPNKNGRAYFMLSQSRSYNGYIMLLETNPGILDMETDEIKAEEGQAVGKIIWNDVYTGAFNGNFNPIGNWSHPGKMDVCGGLLAVAAQNWQPDLGPAAGCVAAGATGPVGRFFGLEGTTSVSKGTSQDAVLLYDVRDPKNPKYISKLSISELKLTGGEISSVALLRSGGDILLNVGGNGSFKTFKAKDKTKPWAIENLLTINNMELTGQHGQNFPHTDGKHHNFVYFDSNNRNNFSFSVYGGLGDKFFRDRIENFPITLPGANRDWDADGLYVSKNGVPIVYTVKMLEGKDAQIYQVVQRPPTSGK